MSGRNSAVVIKARKFVSNPLLSRKQFVLDVNHFGKANIPKKELQEQVAGIYNVDDVRRVSLFGFRTAFGGGKSTGFCCIYDSIEDLEKFEPKHRVIRNGLKQKVESSAKQRKEAKNRKKKVRGTGRRAALHKAKKAQ